MRFITPILDGAAQAAATLGDLLTSLLKAIDLGIGWFDDSADGGLGMVMSGLAGVAAALLVAILFSVYFRSGYRSTRDIVRHSLAAAMLLALLGFAAYDMGHDALAYLGLDGQQAVTGTNSNTGLLGNRVRPPALPTPSITQLAI
ncbi:hypothetical protein CK489_24985 [Bradyrhizobium sp. UFLA03-84]|uniref:hypothetical protein n=1 Tax=Bradyrhizobium sp. UFLA03-84 TaxID=418599 RepID=UPI000BAE0FD5|nr:hypothetical protein [Bradyrhizobium sp. UFLA03-84]PAY06175.1 hypothetical protein CK489_24985 [Bradyrhizobium sp. UFLA03-84]